MDLLRKEKSQIKRLLLKYTTNFLSKEEPEELILLFRQINDKVEELGQIECQITEIMLRDDDAPETDLSIHYDEMEIYKTEVLKCRMKYESSKLSDVVSSTDKLRRKTLPVIQFQMFDGSVKEWLGFWNQFRKVHTDVTIDSEDKYEYLVQATMPGSKARELVESYPPSGENYYKAMDDLKNRFARDDYLVEVYVRELIHLAVSQGTLKKKVQMTELYKKIENPIKALDTLGVTNDKYAGMLFPIVESALPQDVIKRWRRSRPSVKGGQRSKGSELQELMRFLKSTVDTGERNCLEKENLSKCSDKKVKHKEVKSEQLSTKEMVQASTNKTSKSDCLFCEKNHSSLECTKSKNMTVFERKYCVFMARACFLCLNKSHQWQFCKSGIRCLRCRLNHNTILCPGLSA